MRVCTIHDGIFYYLISESILTVRSLQNLLTLFEQVCDGENDCSDHESSDELNCTSIGHSKVIPRPSTEKAIDFPTNTTCLDWMFKCQNNNCLPYWWRCDGINDCGDNSDEVGCGALIGDVSTPAPDADMGRERKCGKTQFTCSPGE